MGPREPVTGARFKAIETIAEATDYISKISFQHPPRGVTHDIARFREKRWACPENLTQWQGRYFNLKMPAAPDPWLHVEDAPKHDKIVVNRTARYHTTFFPWRLIVEKYGDEILFLGLPDEHREFQKQARRTIAYTPTEDFFEAAKIIAGSKLFICNQSSLHWIAAGLGHPYIQETFGKAYARTAIVPRENALHTDSNEGLAQLYDRLELDKQWLHIHRVPKTKVNLGTSAENVYVQKNLSTSAEIYQAVQSQNNEEAISRSADPHGSFAFGATQT